MKSSRIKILLAVLFLLFLGGAVYIRYFHFPRFHEVLSYDEEVAMSKMFNEPTRREFFKQRYVFVVRNSSYNIWKRTSPYSLLFVGPGCTKYGGADLYAGQILDLKPYVNKPITVLDYEVNKENPTETILKQIEINQPVLDTLQTFKERCPQPFK